MYQIAADVKRDPVRRWALPDRVFFACGACHILAHAFLATFPEAGFEPVWIKPAAGYSGNHIVVVRGSVAFDYHGYSNWAKLQAHFGRRARRRQPGWIASLVALPPDVLVSEEKSRRYEGLWLREPLQFLHDANPRAMAYLRRFSTPTREIEAGVPA